jgi:hypothetical protein
VSILLVPEGYSAVQAAHDVAQPGDRISIAPGHVDPGGWVITKPSLYIQARETTDDFGGYMSDVYRIKTPDSEEGKG